MCLSTASSFKDLRTCTVLLQVVLPAVASVVSTLLHVANDGCLIALWVTGQALVVFLRVLVFPIKM